eukprot:TRINITY_DN11150_c0_g1_i3.p2 TRINITY_DN11150_c0_g1~~TRINITY_DN11150_c0_g1_i3.p2  ORF type:complete len:101 (+),score=20.39 TRINITY_DN11150_c0_g1_i3:406-708(+)
MESKLRPSQRLLLRYEEVTANPDKAVQQVAALLGITHPRPIENVMKHSFVKFNKSPMAVHLTEQISDKQWLKWSFEIGTVCKKAYERFYLVVASEMEMEL